MRRQFVLLLIGLFLLLISFGQATLRHLWARGAEVVAETATAQPAPPPDQGASGFLTGPTSGDAVEIALNYLQQQTTRLGYSTVKENALCCEPDVPSLL